MVDEEPKIDELPEFDAGEGIDVSEFDGNKMKIGGVEIREVNSSYGEDGKPLPAGNTRPVKVLRAFSEPVTTVKNAEGEDIEIRASELFNLKLKEGKWGISKSPKSKLQRFLAKQKVSHPKDLTGTEIIVKATENKAGDTFLGFYTA
jgi:hypothetical protein